MKPSAKAAKRKRSMIDALAGVDELLRRRPLYEIDDDEVQDDQPVYPEATLRPQAPARGAAARRTALPGDGSRSSSPTSTRRLPSDSQQSSDSLGDTELARLYRRDDEVADMALFLSQAMANTPSFPSFCALLDHLVSSGVETVLSSLNRNGSLEAFFFPLLGARFPGNGCLTTCPNLNACLLWAIRCLVSQCSLETFCCAPVVECLLSQLQGSLSPNANSRQGFISGGPTTQSLKKRAHWSEGCKQKKTVAADAVAVLAPLVSELEWARLTQLLAQLPSGDANCKTGDDAAGAAQLREECRDPASQALGVLLDLVLRQNQLGGEFAEGTCVARLFGGLGGFRALSAVLAAAVTEALLHETLAFLEVATGSHRVGQDVSLRDVSHVLVPMLTSGDLARGSRARLAVLRVLTNITGISPGLVGRLDLVALGHTIREVLSEPGQSHARGEAAEEATFALCCAVNIVKWEIEGGTDDFTESLDLDGCAVYEPRPDVLGCAARAMLVCYHSGDTADTVLAGYYALFLGVASLASSCARDDGSFRVPVITAVAEATRGMSIGRSSAAVPMKVVVAILQEFLLFQSASGTLTREGMLDMNNILASLVGANKIEITPSGSS